MSEVSWSEQAVRTHPECLSQGEVGEEDVLLLYVAHFSLHLPTHPPPVNKDTPTGERGVACEAVQQCGLSCP